MRPYLLIKRYLEFGIAMAKVPDKLKKLLKHLAHEGDVDFFAPPLSAQGL